MGLSGTRSVVTWYSAGLACTRLWISALGAYALCLMAQAFNSYLWGVEAGGPEVQGHSRQLQGKLRLRETLCLKKIFFKDRAERWLSR